MKIVRKNLFVVACLLIVPVEHLFGQEILFSVDGAPVYTDEFIYTYKKNNINNQKGFSKKDIDDYLDLYINFKLRVHEAYQLKLDTIGSLKNEYEQYKQQIKKPYLSDNNIKEELIREAYDRYQEEIRASHILIRVGPEAPPKDTLTAYQKIKKIKDEAVKGSDFSSLAKQYSEDPGGKINGGDLGYFTSMQMVYPFETGAWNTPVGGISEIVRTRFGYHIIKVTDRRASGGKAEVAHIMVRTMVGADSVNKKAKERIFHAYDQLASGFGWNEVCSMYSEDVNTKGSGGVLQPFRNSVMSLPPEFKDQAFSLANPGDLSDPFTTRYGWHIVKLIEKHPLEGLEEMRPEIQNAIGRDERSQLEERAVIARLKTENGFDERQWVKTKLFTFETTDEIRKNIGGDSTMFSIGDRQLKVSDFERHVGRQNKAGGPGLSLPANYEMFVKEQVLEYEENVLEKKYPEFSYLLQEYREGILLFHLMDEKIWSGAGRDSTALLGHYMLHRDDYLWDVRYDCTIFSSLEEEVIRLAYDQLLADSTLEAGALIEKLPENSRTRIDYEKGKFEQGRHAALNKTLSEGNHLLEVGNIWYLLHIENVLPPGHKEFEEVKGLVMSDYQQVLEERWTDELKNKYVVKLHKKGKKEVYKTLVN